MTKRAIIIEDHVEIGEIYKFTLDTLGYESEQITDGKEALDRLETDIPDLLILDMNLPQVSGHYIYKKLRSKPEWEATPIVISTANTIVANALESEISTIDRIIVKPVRPSDLRTVLEKINS
jgi:DNA-binding response OmpR family regulator